MNIGEALKYQREKCGLSQNTLSKKTGISQPKISYYESNKHLPPIDDLITLANFYGITIDELIGKSSCQ